MIEEHKLMGVVSLYMMHFCIVHIMRSIVCCPGYRVYPPRVAPSSYCHDASRMPKSNVSGRISNSSGMMNRGRGGGD